MFDRKALPVLLLLLFFLMGSWLLQSDELHVEHELPEKMEAGGDVEVPVRVQKGDRTGFAKLELDIPEGLKVEALEKNGSSFTFEKGTAKFIWMAMPEGTEFTVRYRLIAETGIEGKRTIKGDFRYIRDNERKRKKLETKSISVQKELVDSTDPGKDEEKMPPVEVDREITRSEKGLFRVRLTLQKGERHGYGELVERIPEGFEARSDEKMGSTFTFQDSAAKFVWMQMPRDPSFWVQYLLEAKEAQEKGEHLIEGTFSYLEDGKSYEQELPSSSFGTQGTAAMAAKAEEGSTEEKDTTEEGEAGTEGEGAESVTEEDEPEQLTGDVPDPQKKVDYKVQICAGHDPVDEGHFERVYGYEGGYDIEHHEGWIKYTTGLFEVYEKARDQRVQFRKNYELPGPFVTAYNDGERITVQEALMITDQEWVQ